MNETNLTRFKKRALALAIASCMSVPLLAEAASLGKLTVLSGLGQPLRAELELGAAPEEISGMTARLAPSDAFKQAGVDYAPILSELRFALDKRANGASVIRVTSVKPLNEPFLDFLVELNWPSGRLLREYTFLLDPPDISEKPPARSVVDARVVETVRGGTSEARMAAPVRSARPVPAPKVAEEAKKPAEKADTRVVQRGETLRKIAGETQHQGVSLEQMLVGLFRSNPDAFIGHNLNRLKTGAILSIPDQSAVESVSEAEAKKIYVAQAGDWNAYRQKLAAATAKGAAKDDSGSAQAASGKITARVEEKAAPAEKNKDQVKVARADALAKGADAARSAAEEDRVAREKAYKEAQERLLALEKNVGELQKLLDLKNQKLAELQQAPAKKEEPKPAAEPAKPVAEAPKPEVPKPPVEAKPAEPPKIVEEAKPQAAAPAPAPVKPAPKKVAPPPPPPEPELLDSLLEDPLPLLAGGGVLAGLLAFLFIKRRRASGGSALTTTAAPVSSGLGPNSVFRMTGGQSIDTGNTPPQTGDFSQTGPGTIDTDEVDPVAEADVYMAYGRDTQAEEILLEALQKDPQRTAIHAKLLEIYANRGSLKQFETLASELYAQTGGAGPDWTKVAELGARLDPKNPLYSGGHALAAGAVAAAVIPELPVDEPVAVEEPLEPSFDDVAAAAEAPLVDAAAEPLADSVEEAALDFDLGEPAPAVADNALGGRGGYIDTAADEAAPNVLDFDLGGDLSSAAPSSEPKPAPESAPVEEMPSALDFDLGLGAAPAPADKENEFSPEATLIMPLSAFQDEPEFDLGVAEPETPAPVEAVEALEMPEAAEAEPAALDFDFDVLPQEEASPEVAVEPVLEEEAAITSTVIDVAPPAADDLDFDVSLGDSVFLGDAMPAPDFDIGSINLDLSAEPAEPAAVPAAAGEAVRDQRWEEINTKLDLAKAYEEMGDLEGARELLDEVVAEGVADLAEQAKVILARLGG